MEGRPGKPGRPFLMLRWRRERGFFLSFVESAGVAEPKEQEASMIALTQGEEISQVALYPAYSSLRRGFFEGSSFCL
jgi:hypothetical protein